jgi:hypothetical protein
MNLGPENIPVVRAAQERLAQGHQQYVRPDHGKVRLEVETAKLPEPDWTPGSQTSDGVVSVAHRSCAQRKESQPPPGALESF